MTPERTLFRGEVTSVSGRAPKGDFEILDGHACWVSPLDIDVLTVRSPEGEPGFFAVHGGLIEAGPESVLVLADLAEPAVEVDTDRAGRALERAKEHLAQARSKDVDAERARRAMDRAEARLEASAGR